MLRQQSPPHGNVALEESLPLSGRTCVVTGASRGIGREVARHLGQAGANVVVNYRSSEAQAREIADAIDSGDGSAILAQADVGNEHDIEEFATTVADTYGHVDVLVNNAGITADAKFEHMSNDDWQRVIDVNLTGTFNTTKAFYEDIKSSDHGRLINISSVIGVTGNFGQSNYAASKSGLFGFTHSLAKELAPHGSTANCVAPGFTSTDMVEAVPEDIQEKIRDQIPLNRFASVDEIASIVRFLATDEAAFITGETINVNGGMHL